MSGNREKSKKKKTERKEEEEEEALRGRRSEETKEHSKEERDRERRERRENMPTTEETDTETETETAPETERHAEGWAWLLKRREVILSLVGLIVVIFTLLLSRVSDTLLLITPAGDSIAFPDVEASFCKSSIHSFLFFPLICIYEMLCFLFVLLRASSLHFV